MAERRNEARREAKSAHTLPQWNAEYISAEQNIESIGYFSATYSRRSISDSRVSKVVILSDSRKIEILPSKKYGLPNAEDLDFYRAFLKICYERARLVKVEHEGRVIYHPELPIPIGFSSREITVKANKKWSGRTNRAIREWIERLSSTTIHGAIFSAKEQRYDVRIGIEPLFRQYVLVGRPMSDGQLASQNFVWPAQWFIDNYYYLYTRPIDLKFHHRLTCSIAKALYPLLDSGWFASNGSPYTKRYTDLCALLDIQVYRQLSRVQQQLDPSHNELAHEKFLASYDYPLDENGQWTGTIRWWPGPKWLHDQENKSKRKPINEELSLLPASPVVDDQDSDPLAAQMHLPLPAHQALEIPELYENRVKKFYAAVGHTRLSQAKVQAGVAVVRRLAETEGFSLYDIDCALQWIVENLNTKFGGVVKSLGLLPHVISEALREKDIGEKKQKQTSLHVQEVEQEKQRVQKIKICERDLASLSAERQEKLRRQAMQQLREEGVPPRFMVDGLVRERMVEILAKEPPA